MASFFGLGHIKHVEWHYGQIGAGYLLDSRFQEAKLERGVECYVDFLNELPSASQIKKDARALHGTLLSACQSGVRRRILMENRDKQDGIRSWCQLVQNMRRMAIKCQDQKTIKCHEYGIPS
jgi:hypothetical protein